MPLRRIAAACLRVGALEAGFTVEPWPTIKRALDELEATKKTSNAQRRTSNPEFRKAASSPFEIQRWAFGVGRFLHASLN
jgi:hypothetical protein